MCDIVKISKSLTLKSTCMVLSKNNRAIADAFNGISKNHLNNEEIRRSLYRDGLSASDMVPTPEMPLSGEADYTYFKGYIGFIRLFFFIELTG